MMPREILTVILLILLIVCAVAVNVIPNLLQAVITFMAYSSIMAVVWILMESPDLGITEAAVGAGVSGIMFLMTLKKIHAEGDEDPADILEKTDQEDQDSSSGSNEPAQDSAPAEIEEQRPGGRDPEDAGILPPDALITGEETGR